MSEPQPLAARLIEYQPIDLAEPAELVAAIRQRRGGQLLNLDRMLLHSPAVANGWNQHLGAIRGGLSLDPKLREIGMCGVAVLNGAEYEFIHHAPPFRDAGGTEEQIEALRLLGQSSFPKALFTSLEQDAAKLTVQMTRSIKVDAELMRRLQAALGNTGVVELVSVIATYNMVSRFLIALDVTPEDH
jgi:alkylhydroperoxidase family enzyme